MIFTDSALLTLWDDPGTCVAVVANVRDEPKPVRIATLPLSWLQSSETNHWHYLTEISNMCVNEAGRLQDEKGSWVDVTSMTPPVAGTYTFVPNHGEYVTLSTGPIGKRMYRVPSMHPSEASDSTMSRSSRSSCDTQSKLRDQLLARDGQCVVSEEDHESCVAAHIIPVSRSDMNFSLGTEHALAAAQIWDDLGVRWPYFATCGLLLSRRLHKSFDRYEWALYPLGDGNFVVHYFHPSSDCDVAYHGKVISRSHFRGFKGKLPGEAYVRWHYRQCVLMNLRGIAVREVYVWTTVLVFYPPCLVFEKLTAFYYVPCERTVVGTTTLPSGTGDDSELYHDVET